MRVCRWSICWASPCAKLTRIGVCRRLQLIYQVFFHNHDDSVDLRLDTLLQPIFFVTDRLAKYLGRLFICFFLIIMSAAVYIFYTAIFVHLFREIETDTYHGQHTYLTFLWHVIVAHWLLINIMFNYLQCVRVDPGSSPNFGHSKPYDFDKNNRDRMKIHQAKIDKNNNKSTDVTIVNLTNEGKILRHEHRGDAGHRRFHVPLIFSSESTYSQLQSSATSNVSSSSGNTTNICRKCIFPKPARAHHCSICARCILNQDHHCPWINNCVGHLNHRYFFQFCFFLTIGAFYAASFGFTEFQHYLFGRKAFTYLDLFSGQRLNDVEMLPHITNPSNYFTFLFLFIVAATACVVLSGFTLWHFWLISHGETTIEFHTNSTERKRLKKINEKFDNPYNLGFILNWKMFLGVNKWYEVLYKNCLPSTHRPLADGVKWPMRIMNKSVEEKKKSALMHV